MNFRAVALMVFGGLLLLTFFSGSYQPTVGVEIGDRAPKIESYLLHGTSFDSRNLEGKMVLIDFWASYDASSRVESYGKKMLLERYGNGRFVNSDSFVIVSISLDRFKTPLYQVIERDELYDFYHLCDFMGGESELAAMFEVGGEMMDYLIDGNGRIVAKSKDLAGISAALEKLEAFDGSRYARNQR